MKYKKKTEFVDAIQFDGTNGEEIENWVDHWVYFDKNKDCYVARLYGEVIPVRAGDYIVKHRDGSISLCLKAMFEETYEVAKNLTFSEALIMLKNGYQVRRAAWRPGTYLTITSETKTVKENVAFEQKFVCMCNKYAESGGLFSYSWAPISRDMFADDWEIVK